MSDGLYPEIEPYQTAFLERDGHRLYYELSGNPEGPTALFLHGGPGGGTSPRVRRSSTLRATGSCCSISAVQEESPQRQPRLRGGAQGQHHPLVDDIEALREALALDQWQRFLAVRGSTSPSPCRSAPQACGPAAASRHLHLLAG